MSVSKRLRYEVFRRDNFTCRYCGAKPPEAQLRPDHVIPVTLGGTDDPANLATSCEACNSGKTSTTPHAPLVADVADKALEWAEAMRHAQAKMLAEIDARAADRAQFQEWWDAWSYGTGTNRALFPKDRAWWVTVDQLLSAGLPLPVLRDCIDLTMTRRTIKAEAKFRYMCGIAWNKVKELQETARLLASGDPAEYDDEDLSPEEIKGRASLACELLGDCGRSELDRLMAEARENWQAETEDEENIAAAQISWHQTRIDLSWLAFSLCDLLPMLPDAIIEEAMRIARVKLYDERGPGFSRIEFVTRVVDLAAVMHGSPLASAKETAPF